MWQAPAPVPARIGLPHGQVYLLKITIGLLPIAGSHLAQAFHQSILRGAEESSLGRFASSDNKRICMHNKQR